MKAAFFGTPSAAVPALDALIRSPHDVLAVVTAPDRARGRGMKLQPTPVKEAALAGGLPVLQPPTLRQGGTQDSLAGLDADVFVVCAYGFILPKAVLDTPPRGCVNVHFSLLPRWRGAAPVERAILAGDDETGVSIMAMDEGLDTGPVLARSAVEIRPEDTGGSLTGRLAETGAQLLISTLEALEAGGLEPAAQDDAAATLAPKIDPQEARIDWSEDAEVIRRKVQAFDPRPGAWTTAGGSRLKLFGARAGDPCPGTPPGTIGAGPDGGFRVATGTVWIELEQVQPEGKRRMEGREYLRGRRDLPGNILT